MHGDQDGFQAMLQTARLQVERLRRTHDGKAVALDLRTLWKMSWDISQNKSRTQKKR